MNYTNKIVRRAVSQVEVVISAFLVGVVVVGSLELVGASVRTNRIAAAQLDAPTLAYTLMGEILALPYEDPDSPGGAIGLETGESGTNRNDFDDIDDYNNWDQSPPQNKDGTALQGYNSWQRRVYVTNFDPVTGNNTGTDTGVKCVRVELVVPGRSNYEIKALHSKWGALEQIPSTDTTVVTSIEAELQIGASAEPAIASTPLKNHADE